VWLLCRYFPTVAQQILQRHPQQGASPRAVEVGRNRDVDLPRRATLDSFTMSRRHAAQIYDLRPASRRA